MKKFHVFVLVLIIALCAVVTGHNAAAQGHDTEKDEVFVAEGEGLGEKSATRVANIVEAKRIEKELMEKKENGNITPEQLDELARKRTKRSMLEVYYRVKIPKRIFWFLTLGIWVVFVIMTTLLYFYYAKGTDEFRFKSRSMALVASITGLIFTTHAMTTEALVPYYPCFLRIWIGYITLSVFSVSIIVRAISYISQVRMIIFKNEISSLLTQLEKAPEEDEQAAHKEFMKKSVFVRYYRVIVNTEYPENIYDKQAELQFRLATNSKIHDLVRTRNYLILLAITIVVAVAFSAYFSTYDEYHFFPISYDCKAGISTPVIPLYVFLLISIITLIPLTFLCFGFKDAYGMQIELVITMIYSVISIIAFVLYNEFVPPTVLMYTTGYVFIMPIFFLQHIFIIVNPLLKLYKARRVTKKINKDPTGLAASSKREQFEGLLAYPAGFSRLCQAALETFCPENVEFLKEYQLLKYKICSFIIANAENNDENVGDDDKSLASIDLGEDNRGQSRSRSNSQGQGQTIPAKRLGPNNESINSDANTDDGRSLEMDRSLTDKKNALNMEKPALRNHSSFYMGTVDSLGVNESVDMDQLIGGDLVPPLPITIPEAVYKMGLMLDLHLINETEGFKNRNTPKMTRVPAKLKEEYFKLYTKFIQTEAVLAVNIPDKISAPLDQAASDQNYTLGIFDDALEEVLKSLYTNTYPVMLKTL